MFRPSIDSQEQAKSIRLLPKEHGAYGQLLVPLLVSLSLGKPTVASSSFAVAAVASFLAHEPLLILLGQRGKRATQVASQRSFRWLIAWSAIALAALVLAVAQVSLEVRWATLLPVALSLSALVLALVGRERSILGQCVVAATLPALALPVALAQGLELEAALAAWAAWTLASIAATGAVKGAIGSFKYSTGLWRRLSLPLFAWTILFLILWIDGHAGKTTVAATPTLIVATIVSIVAPHPRHLKRLGWTLVGSSLACALWLAIALRN